MSLFIVHIMGSRALSCRVGSIAWTLEGIKGMLGNYGAQVEIFLSYAVGASIVMNVIILFACHNICASNHFPIISPCVKYCIGLHCIRPTVQLHWQANSSSWPIIHVVHA